MEHSYICIYGKPVVLTLSEAGVLQQEMNDGFTVLLNEKIHSVTLIKMVIIE